mmetsp:Transcript_9829/g.32473  ORF Transcript_9829/g.32473 Transcript_9829/m.32473 type:complete len:206 (+) Transcript_9829:132-749(+)
MGSEWELDVLPAGPRRVEVHFVPSLWLGQFCSQRRGVRGAGRDRPPGSHERRARRRSRRDARCGCRLLGRRRRRFLGASFSRRLAAAFPAERRDRRNRVRARLHFKSLPDVGHARISADDACDARDSRPSSPFARPHRDCARRGADRGVGRHGFRGARGGVFAYVFWRAGIDGDAFVDSVSGLGHTSGGRRGAAMARGVPSSASW